MQTAALVEFVRGTLGCRCPDDVFRSFAIDAAETRDGALKFTRLAIGGRLLIYVMATQAPADVPGTVRALTRLGRSERDGGGYNRFRLVCQARDVALTSAAAEATFARAAEGDDRAHLHVVHEGAVPDLHPKD